MPRGKLGFPGGSDGKDSAYNAGDLGSIPGSGRYPGEGNGNTLQCSGLENPMDRGAWWATVHGVARVGHNLETKPLNQYHMSFNKYTKNLIAVQNPCLQETYDPLGDRSCQSLKKWWYGVKAIELVQSSKVKVKVLVAQSCLILCYPIDCNLPGSSVHGIL